MCAYIYIYVACETQWLQDAYKVASSHWGEHFMLCLGGLPDLVSEVSILSEKEYVATHATHVLLQDVVLVLIQLWCAGKHFAAVLPRWDSSLTALLKRIPGVNWQDGDGLTFYHSFVTSSLPCVLFHLI